MPKKRSLLRFPPQSFVTALQANGSFFTLLPPEQLHSAERFHILPLMWSEHCLLRLMILTQIFQMQTHFFKVSLKFPNPRSSRKGESLTRPYKLRYLVVKKNALQKDKTASWPPNPICVLICGRRSQHLVNIVNSLQIYMSKPTLFCRNRSLPASFGA